MNKQLQEQIQMMMGNGKPTPVQNQMLQTLLSGDASKNEELANNLCKSRGVSPDQVYPQALAWAKSTPQMAGILKMLGIQ